MLKPFEIRCSEDARIVPLWLGGLREERAGVRHFQTLEHLDSIKMGCEYDITLMTSSLYQNQYWRM
jgi:hypothetical protein